MRHGDLPSSDFPGLHEPMGTPMSDEVRIAQLYERVRHYMREYKEKNGVAHPAERQVR